MKLEFDDHKHSTYILQALNIQRQKKECCDVVINVGSHSFAAHQNILTAVSPYVKDLIYSCNIQPSDELSVTIDIDYMSPLSVEQLLDYFYTGKIIIADKNVEDLLKGAKYFMIKRLKSHCVEYLELILDRQNYMYTLMLAENYDLLDLSPTVYTYVRDQFFDLCCTNEFLECPYHILLKLIKDEDLHAANEDQVLLTLIRWTKHNLEDRKVHFSKLFSNIYLNGVTDEMLSEVSSEEQLIKNNANAVCAIVDVLSRRKQENPTSLLHFQRKGTLMDVVLVLGGQSSDGNFRNGVYAYIIDENKWIKVTHMPYRAAALGAVSTQKYLYVTGGTNEQNASLKSAWRYDLDKATWSKLPDLPMGLVFHSMIACNGLVYTVGGSVAPRKYISTIYRYDEKKEKWTTIGRMSVPMDCAEIVTKGDRYIYIATGRCMINERISRVGVVDCFDTITGEVKQSLTFPIEFKHRPVVAFHGEHNLSVQSHKHNIDVNLQKFKANKTAKRVPLLPNSTKLEVCHAMCLIRDMVFVCGGTSAMDDGDVKEYSVNKNAFVLEANAGMWKEVAKPIEALESSACCRTKLQCKLIQKPEKIPTKQKSDN
ncbi:calicin [Callorhinchus milii]|uniref:Calicin n=1 Tax=Callorhinchus milii TaxID=7868 RepID=A0A4W3HKS3_CALMI|nr:calicin [Callorhinchus milii]|eukprot:gi/632939191/ref/XP_007908117.1/ PREDICTED: calicin [Callorhinchus milii]